MTDDERGAKLRAWCHALEDHAISTGKMLDVLRDMLAGTDIGYPDHVRVHAPRAVLDDAPSVEWHTQSNGDKYAELDGGWKLLTQQCDDGGYSVTVRRGTDLSASEWHIPYSDSAKARAVALYVALRWVK